MTEVRTPEPVAEGPPQAEVVQAGERRSVRLESIRGFGAIAVVLTHIFAYEHHFEPVIYQGYSHKAIMYGGDIALQLFFALSGYLLYRPFARRDFVGGEVSVRSYALNRALRVLPLYYTVVILLLIFQQHGGTWTEWWRFLLFSEEFSVKTAQTVDGPIWSLVVEITFYILLPFLAWAVARLARGSALRAGGMLLVLGGLSAVFHQSHPTPALIWSYSFPATFYGFIPGMLVALVDVSWRGQAPGWLRGFLGRSDTWFVGCVACWLILFWKPTVSLLWSPSAFLLVGACVLPLRSKNLVRVLDWRPIGLLGVVSYSLYLWHVPIITKVLPHAPHGTWGLALVVYPLGLVAAVLSYSLVERPMLQLRRRWQPGEAGAQRSGGGSPRRFAASWSYRESAVGIAVAALVVRLAAIEVTHPLKLASDPTDYDRLARLLAAGHGFGTSLLSPSGGPTAFRAPLYPMFLAAVYKVTGDSVTAARVVEAFLGVVTVGLIGLIGYLLLGRQVGFVAAGLAAVFPTMVIYSTSILSESIYLPLEMFAVAAVLLARRESARRYLWWIAAGVSAGLGALARPNGAVLVIGLAALIATAVPRQSWPSTLKAVGVLALSAIVVVVPWEIRDAVKFHKFIPISTVDGFNLAGVYNSEAAAAGYPDHYQWRPPSGVPALRPLFSDTTLDEEGLDHALTKRGMDWIRDHPAAVPSAMAWNTGRMAELGGLNEATVTMQEAGYGRRAAIVEMAAIWLALALSIAALATRRFRKVPWAFWLSPVLLWLISVPFLGTARIRSPIDPFLLILAAIAIVGGVDRFKASRSSGSAAA